jgi:hypothetical protein
MKIVDINKIETLGSNENSGPKTKTDSLQMYKTNTYSARRVLDFDSVASDWCPGH